MDRPGSERNDPQYQRMLADIEALQHRQGWLAGRGAFDKDNLLYQRDKEQEQQLQEQHKRNPEAAAFAAARAQAEQQSQQQAAAKLRQQDATTLQEPARRLVRLEPKLRVVPAKPAQQSPQQQLPQQPQVQPVEATADEAASKPPAKRLRAESGPAQVAGSSTPVAAQPQQQHERGMQATCTAAAEPLHALLGSYGSDDLCGGEAQQPTNAQQHSSKQPSQAGTGVCGQRKVQLPSAAELLQAEVKSSVGQPAPLVVTAQRLSMSGSCAAGRPTQLLVLGCKVWRLARSVRLSAVWLRLDPDKALAVQKTRRCGGSTPLQSDVLHTVLVA